jgi:carbamoyltransferase
MITLGINAALHDSAAALVRDGVLVAAAEEERFTRIKHGKRPVPFSAWELPYHAIEFCLAEAGVTLGEVDHVAYGYDPHEFLHGRPLGDSIALPLAPGAADGWDSPWDALFAAHVLNAPGHLLDGAPHHLQHRFNGARDPATGQPRFRWHYVGHHLAHQASAFLAAPFARCAVMTVDGRGERTTTAYGRYADGCYAPLGQVAMPHSLGLLYERLTAHLGFLHSSDEYKVMALAAFGTPRHLEALRRHVALDGAGGYRIDDVDLTALFGPPRARGAPMRLEHYDAAASLQALLEETVLSLARWLREASGEAQLAMAGGVALNCVMNSVLRDAGIFDAVWIQPAAGDAGTALGAALWVDARERGSADALAPRAWTMQHAHWGPQADDASIESFLRWAKLPYRLLDDPAAEVAELLAQDRIFGWYQGKMEFGPRALGARSIIASPLSADMQERLNQLKDREDFRPVAPAVPAERLAEWFEPGEIARHQSQFMLFLYRARAGRAERIPAAVHVDGTARVQAVERAANPRFHALLEAFGARTGVPVLVNTSFNVRGEPIVCTPRDAVDAFYSTPLDGLVLGNCLLMK